MTRGFTYILNRVPSCFHPRSTRSSNERLLAFRFKTDKRVCLAVAWQLPILDTSSYWIIVAVALQPLPFESGFKGYDDIYFFLFSSLFFLPLPISKRTETRTEEIVFVVTPGEKERKIGRPDNAGSCANSYLFRCLSLRVVVCRWSAFYFLLADVSRIWNERSAIVLTQQWYFGVFSLLLYFVFVDLLLVTFFIGFFIDLLFQMRFLSYCTL